METGDGVGTSGSGPGVVGPPGRSGVGGGAPGAGSSLPPPKTPMVTAVAAPPPIATAIKAPLPPIPVVAPVELMNRSMPVAAKPGGMTDAPGVVLPTTMGGGPSSLSSHSSAAVTREGDVLCSAGRVEGESDGLDVVDDAFRFGRRDG